MISVEEELKNIEEQLAIAEGLCKEFTEHNVPWKHIIHITPHLYVTLASARRKVLLDDTAVVRKLLT